MSAQITKDSNVLLRRKCSLLMVSRSDFHSFELGIRSEVKPIQNEIQVVGSMNIEIVEKWSKASARSSFERAENETSKSQPHLGNYMIRQRTPLIGRLLRLIVDQR